MKKGGHYLCHFFYLKYNKQLDIVGCHRDFKFRQKRLEIGKSCITCTAKSKCDASGVAPLTSNGVNYSESVKKDI